MMSVTHGFRSSNQSFSFGPWTITAVKTHIMKSKDIERLAEEMKMPSLPEMLFGDNVLRIQHVDGFGVEFNAIDALKCVNNLRECVKVACAEEWRESRPEAELSSEQVKHYDWTYTTDYRGTLLGETNQITEVLLFEDELHDHGVSTISAKIAGKSHMLREFSTRESSMKDLHVPPAVYTDPCEIAQYLTLKLTECEKLVFPETSQSPAESSS
ncbi:hypothetical protein DNTS_029840 [Danionella cerebrum]|uniref:TIP41-like protein n=1 Tax=Danionella cerebrum TaxID=2873325 RepID=A0A553QYC9_9TELE|nr:hypothetical protein DNTS_029840 [Danionella translucida]